MASPREDRFARIALVVVFAVVGIGPVLWALAAVEAQQDTSEAEKKAAELSAAFERANLPAPSEDLVVQTLGDDGGALCGYEDNALARATLDRELSNGAALTGSRPIVADRRVIQGVRLRVEVYCPDQLPRFLSLTRDLRSADMIRE